ncbi:MAG: LytTR family DNA-binding domain-containing protein [Chitinophagaceae bacterium]
MKCIIVDDDSSFRIILSSLIQDVDYLSLEADFEDAKDGYNYLSANKIDLLFLDIEMPKLSGFDFLESIEHKPLTIICSSKKEYAMQAFEYQAIDYILKPVTETRFLKAVSKAKSIIDAKQQLVENHKEFIFIKDKGVLTKVKFEDILFIQAMGDYMKIMTKDKWYVLHSTMKTLESILPQTVFFRSHRSFLININNIDKIEDNTAYFQKTPVVISDQYKQDLLKKINYI